jgi:SAM-dependent methyltransferase
MYETKQLPHTSARRTVGELARQFASIGKRTLFPTRDQVFYKGSVLPHRDLRFNGPDQQVDAFYLASAIAEAKRVVRVMGYTPRGLLVDIGCGQGRLAIGLIRDLPQARYLGLDVSARSIDWCAKHLESRHPSYRFRHVNLVNALYNPLGNALAPAFRLPVASGVADMVYMWGVVTNMEPEHLVPYAQEISRILRPGGKLFLTANVEASVPQVSINPENYVPFVCRGPLHIVRYEKQYFLDVFQHAGLKLTQFAYHAAGNCQSEMYFAKERHLDLKLSGSLDASSNQSPSPTSDEGPGHRERSKVTAFDAPRMLTRLGRVVLAIVGIIGVTAGCVLALTRR